MEKEARLKECRRWQSWFKLGTLTWSLSGLAKMETVGLLEGRRERWHCFCGELTGYMHMQRHMHHFATASEQFPHDRHCQEIQGPSLLCIPCGSAVGRPWSGPHSTNCMRGLSLHKYSAA